MGRQSRHAEEMLPPLRRHEIQVVLRAGFGAQDVATRTSTSVDTVRRVHRADVVTHADDTAAHRTRGIGRPSKTAAFAEKVTTWLREEREVPTQELLRRAKESSDAGNKTAFYALVAGMRRRSGASKDVRASPRTTTSAIDVTLVDGRKKWLHFFASRLKFSRFFVVSIVEHERVETLVRHFVAFGGLPLLAVFDRPRTVVSRSSKGRGRDIQRHVRAGDHRHRRRRRVVCRAEREPEGCGRVARGWVKRSFFKPRKFKDDRALEAQLASRLVEANTTTPSCATGVSPETKRRDGCVVSGPQWCFRKRSRCASAPSLAASRSRIDDAPGTSRMRRCPNTVLRRLRPSMASARRSTRSASSS